MAGAASTVACVGDKPSIDEPTTADASTNADAGGGGDLCPTYCTEVAKSCTGANRQYRNAEECLRACALLPKGTEEDRELNTVGCRLRQARAASSLDTCIVAGPFGGGKCGSRCEAFCDVVVGNCAELGSASPYNSKSTCLEECPRFVLDPAEGEGPDQVSAGNDSLNCRTHHSILALGDKVVHCPHTGVVSPVCLVRDAGHDGH
jgi:hypothetical protein